LRASRQHQEQGYALVALLALMTVLALFALAAAPSIRQQAQREREIEAIFRGEEVADAIRIYYSYQVRLRGPGGGEAALPTSIEQLLEGVPSGTKKVQVLRASAARDPLVKSGEWKLIRPRSAQLSDFQRSVMLFGENVLPTTRDPQLAAQQQYMAGPVLPTSGLPSAGLSSASDDSSSGPFIGVASESKSNSVINYYGIDRHDGWIFTPLFR
jgi:type II secretory pathway pseudopilin PulG